MRGGADLVEGDAVLNANLQDPNAIEAYINKNMPAEVDPNARALLTAGMKSCFQAAKNWKNNQKKEGADTFEGYNYFDNKTKLDADKNVMLNALKFEVQTATDQFNNSMTALKTGESLVTPKTSCNFEDADDSLRCYKLARDNVEDAYRGNGTKTKTSIQIGSATVQADAPVGTDILGRKEYWKPGMSGYLMTCHGLKGCVAELKKHSGQIRKEIAKVKSMKSAKAGEANQAIKKVLGQAANQVAAAQAAMKAALDGIRAQASKMGAKDLPKDPKALEAMGQKDWPKMSGLGEEEKDAGPFVHPGADMKKVLAGMGSGAWRLRTFGYCRPN